MLIITTSHYKSRYIFRISVYTLSRYIFRVNAFLGV
nr:MAG TPA: hypothetical protein [Caudoviricetes sp.]